MAWGEHINDLCLKLSQVAGIIYKTRTLLSQKARLLIYHSLVSSKLRYGLICWGTASKFLLRKINVAHNKIIRYLTFSKPCSRAWPLYCQLKVLPLEILIQIEWGKIIYRHKSHTLPPVFNNYFHTPSHNHNTRYASNNNLEVVRVTHARDKALLRYIRPKVWSEIPSTIKESNSVTKSFVTAYRSYLLDNFSGQV